MHATIQKPIDEILGYLKLEERVFVVGCGNCTAKCHSGVEPETKKWRNGSSKRALTLPAWPVPTAV